VYALAQNISPSNNLKIVYNGLYKLEKSVFVKFFDLLTPKGGVF